MSFKYHYEFVDVQICHEKFDLMRADKPRHLTRRKLQERIDFLQEELNEFTIACDTQDLAEQADALIDLVYVAMGTAVMLGLPWKQLWSDVNRANMAKVRGVGKRGHKVDLVKPPGWRGPMTRILLANAGYKRSDFTFDDTNKIDEELCHDDE